MEKGHQPHFHLGPVNGIHTWSRAQLEAIEKLNVPPTSLVCSIGGRQYYEKPVRKMAPTLTKKHRRELDENYIA